MDERGRCYRSRFGKELRTVGLSDRAQWAEEGRPVRFSSSRATPILSASVDAGSTLDRDRRARSAVRGTGAYPRHFE